MQRYTGGVEMCRVGLGPGCVSGTRKSHSWRFSTLYDTFLCTWECILLLCCKVSIWQWCYCCFNVSQRQQRNIQYFLLYTKVHYSAAQSLQRKPPSFSMPSFTPGAVAHPSSPLLLPDLPFRTHASRYRAKSAIFFYGRKVKAKVQDIFLPYSYIQPWP